MHPLHDEFIAFLDKVIYEEIKTKFRILSNEDQEREFWPPHLPLDYLIQVSPKGVHSPVRSLHSNLFLSDFLKQFNRMNLKTSRTRMMCLIKVW